MGVAGILPRLSTIMHKINIHKLRNDSFRDYHVPLAKSNQDSERTGEGEGRGVKRTLADIQEGNGSAFISRQSKIRVGIDIMLWISKQCHGRGGTLLDERHLTNYGRAEIFRENRQHPQHQGEFNSTKLKKNYARNESIASDANNIKNIERQRKLELEFVSNAATSVVRNVISLKLNLGADMLVVFDGASPPIKYKCCQSRKSNRDSAAAKRDELNEIQPEFAGYEFHDNEPRIVDVEINAINSSSKIRAAQKAGAYNELHCNVISAVMKLLRDEKIAFLVAPYEADGQLAYLSNKGFIDLIVSEDSDFIGHGVESVLYKFKNIVDREKCRETSLGLTGDLLRKSDFGATSPSFSLAKFSDVMLSVLLVAAGCDYNNSLQGVGIVTARNVVEEAFENQSKEQQPTLERVIQNLFRNSSSRLCDEEKGDYEYKFLAALAMFRHPVVFDPFLGTCLFKGPPDPELMEYKPYCQIITDKSNLSKIVGRIYSKKLGIYVAEGWINPRTWSLRDKESETPANVLEEWQKKLFSVQENVTSIKSVSLQNKVKVRMKEIPQNGSNDKDIEVIDISDQSDSEIETQIETQEIGIYLTTKTPTGGKNVCARSRKKGEVVKVINMYDQDKIEEQIEIEEIEESPMLKSSAWDKENKNFGLETLKYRTLSLENENKEKDAKVVNMCEQNGERKELKKKEVRRGFLTTIQSQSSNCTSLASKPSTQASNQSSNISVDVLSPNLLPSPITLMHSQYSCIHGNKNY